jgi:predicted phosphodiesterase
MGRIVVVTDIHGQYTLLMRALEYARFSDTDRIINLGDLIDRGTQSREVVEFFVERKRHGRFDVHIKGDHEQIALEALKGDKAARRQWLELYHGIETLKSYGALMNASLYEVFPISHLKFLREMLPGYDLPNYAFRHGSDDYVGDKILICGHNHEKLVPRVERGRINLALTNGVAILDLDSFEIWDSDGHYSDIDEALLSGIPPGP